MAVQMVVAMAAWVAVKLVVVWAAAARAGVVMEMVVEAMALAAAADPPGTHEATRLRRA